MFVSVAGILVLSGNLTAGNEWAAFLLVGEWRSGCNGGKKEFC